MNKKEVMKHYKKGTEVKLVALNNTSEARGHVTGYWQMMDNNWSVEVLIIGQEKPLQVSTDDVIRVFKDEDKEKAEASPKAEKVPDTGKSEEKVPAVPIIVNVGDVVDEETGEVIRKVPPAEALHPMEKPAKAAVVIDAELTEELNKCESVAAKIRLLLGKNIGRSQVANMLGVGYRYVYAIEHKPLKRELPLILVPHNTTK